MKETNIILVLGVVGLAITNIYVLNKLSDLEKKVEPTISSINKIIVKFNL